MFNLFSKKFTANDARNVSRNPVVPLSKLKISVYDSIKSAATQGETEVEFKFPNSTTINQVRQIHVLLNNDGYVFKTEFFYASKDVRKNVEGVLDLRTLNDYANFSLAKMIITWSS